MQGEAVRQEIDICILTLTLACWMVHPKMEQHSLSDCEGWSCVGQAGGTAMQSLLEGRVGCLWGFWAWIVHRHDQASRDGILWMQEEKAQREAAEERASEAQGAMAAREAQLLATTTAELTAERAARERHAAELASLREQAAASRQSAATAQSALAMELEALKSKVAALERQKAETEVRGWPWLLCGSPCINTMELSSGLKSSCSKFLQKLFPWLAQDMCLCCHACVSWEWWRLCVALGGIYLSTNLPLKRQLCSLTT